MRLEDLEGQPSKGSVKHGRGLDLILSEMGVMRGSGIEGNVSLCVGDRLG